MTGTSLASITLGAASGHAYEQGIEARPVVGVVRVANQCVIRRFDGQDEELPRDAQRYGVSRALESQGAACAIQRGLAHCRETGRMSLLVQSIGPIPPQGVNNPR